MTKKTKKPDRGLLDLFDLFDEGPEPPFVKGSGTSKEAAATIKPSATVLRAKVGAHIESMGDHGATDEETQKALTMNPNTQRPRRVELVEQGAVIDSGFKRPTVSGRNAVVWVSVPKALRTAQKVETKAKSGLLKELIRLAENMPSEDVKKVIEAAKQVEIRKVVGDNDG